MNRNDPKSKKIVFYDSTKRHADLKIRLQHDGLSQAHFFRGIVTGYLSQDENVLNFIDKLKSSKKFGQAQNKKDIRESRALIKKGKDISSKLSLEEGEIEDIFDLLEKANPDL